MKKLHTRLACLLLAVVMLMCLSNVTPVLAASAGSRLQGMNKTIYDFLKTQITTVANGEQPSTEFTFTDDSLKWTKADLGVTEILSGGAISSAAKSAMNAKFNQLVDFSKINNSLIADCPFELFWYDKSIGVSVIPGITANESEMKITKISFQFTVSSEYSAGDYQVDTAKIKAAASVINNAKAIVAKHSAKSDLEKLTAYKDEICALVDYNQAVANNPSAPYGNAYQLISVFDNDPNTKVVCEGYAKAFKLLCDLSTFKGNVACYLVDGYMQGGTGAGNHSWNVVEIDGGTLLVDITNCDSGSVGYPDQLFLKVGNKNGNTYSFQAGATTIYYVYSETEYGLHSDGYLDLKVGNTAPPAPTTTPTVPATPAPTDPATNPPTTAPTVTTPTAQQTVPPTVATKPVETQPITTAPTVPKATEPVTNAPTEPVQIVPVATEPTETAPTEPTDASPAETEPQTAAPTEMIPEETIPAVTEATISETVPVDSSDSDGSDSGILVYIIAGVIIAGVITTAVILLAKKKKQ